MGTATSAGVPPEIVARLQRAIVASLKTKPVTDVIIGAGWLVVASSSEEFRSRVQDEFALHRTLLEKGQ